MSTTKGKTRRRVIDMTIAGLRLCGIWRIDSSTAIYFKILHFISYVFGTLISAIFIGTIIADFVLYPNNLIIVTEDWCNIVDCLLILFKIFTFHRHRERFSKLADAIYRPIEIIQLSTDTELLKELKSNIRTEEITFYLFNSMGVAAMIFILLDMPTDEGYSLPIRAVFPFDTTVFPTRELAYIIQIYSLAYLIIAIVMIDITGGGLVRWINFQVAVLTHNYQQCNMHLSKQKTLMIVSDDIFENENNNAKMQDDETDDNIMNNSKDDECANVRAFIPFDDEEMLHLEDNWSWRYQTCIKNHQRLTEMVDELNELFGSCLLMHLFDCFSVICTSTFLAVLGPEETSNVMYFFYILASSSQLLYYCWYGNILYYQGLSLITAQWMSGWEHENLIENGSLLIISMIKSLKPIELQAGSFFTISMRTYISILRSAYSFFTILSSFNNDGN